MTVTTATLPTSVPLGPALSEEQAREIFRQGEEAVVFALLSLAQQLAEPPTTPPPVVTPTTPSAMIPPYLKPKADGRRKRPGRKHGHPGSRRPTPEPNRRVRSSPRILSRLSRAADPDQSDADPPHRGHPRGDHAGRHRAHHPPRLVPALSEGRRAGRHRRPARGHARQSHAGPLRLAPLRAGQHPLADRRRLQPPSDAQGHPRRPDPDVVPAPGDPLRLVSGDPGPGVGFGGLACRRDRLAGQWQDPLALVLHDDRSDLLHDRSESRQSGVEAVLQGRVRRDVGHRFLGGLQRGRLREEAEMPGASAPRVEDGGEVRPSRAELAGVRQEVATPAGRRDPAEETRGVCPPRNMPRGVRG